MPSSLECEPTSGPSTFTASDDPPSRSFLRHLRARRRIGGKIAEDVLNRGEQMGGVPLVGVQRFGMTEDREVRAPLAVLLDPGKTVILIRPCAQLTEPPRRGAIRLVHVDAQQH